MSIYDNGRCDKCGWWLGYFKPGESEKKLMQHPCKQNQIDDLSEKIAELEAWKERHDSKGTERHAV